MRDYRTVITVQCPYCDEFVRRPDGSVGQYGDCPECGELFVTLAAVAAAEFGTEAATQTALDHGSDFRLPSRQPDDEHESESDVTFDQCEPAEFADELSDASEDEFQIDASRAEDSAVEAASRWARLTMLVRSKHSKPYLVSAGVHAILLLILAAWILPQLPASETFLTLMPETELDLLEVIDIDLNPEILERDPVAEPLVFHQPDIRLPEPVVTVPGLSEDSHPPTDSKSKGKPNSPATNDDDSVAERAVTSISQASTVEGASDTVAESIRGKVEEKDTLVVWLMDRSISMERQRELLADRVGDFLREVHENETGEFHELMHIVVAFGAAPEKMMATGNPEKALVAMRRKYAVDPSGLENVFTAIEWAADQFVARNVAHRAKNLMFVVSTDESGDDYLRMERTINTCRRHGIEVSVIGPSAVLGQMRGYHSFTASDNRIYYLPVVRGPDTALPQRLKLPYWFRGVPARWDESRRGPWPGKAPAWQGGSNLDAMLSGFGPYALTRLTLATGGDYIVYDRPSDRSPFRMDELRPYLPDYRSPDVIQADLLEHPLRLALMKVVRETHRLDLKAPQTDFGVQYGGSFYLTPEQFRGQLPGQLKREVQRAVQTAAAIEQILANLDNRVVDGLNEQEPSPRWQAWHDLTVGRLRAGRVRNLAYAEFVSRLSTGQLARKTNGLALSPTRLARTSELVAAAEEARELLERCREQHQGTPWGILAERELMFEFGVSIRERTVPAARRPTGRPPRAVSLPRL